MNTSAQPAHQPAASSPNGTVTTKVTRTVAILTTLLILASHALANDPYGWETSERDGTGGFARPVAVRVVVYPFAALEDALAPRFTAQVDPSTRALLESAGVTRIEDLPYPMAALVSTSAATARVDRSTRALLEMAGVTRVEDLPYPLGALVSHSHEDAPVQVEPHRVATSDQPRAPRIEIFVYPFGDTGDLPVEATTTD